MPLSRSRDYMSIGEVLESVRTDFPDVTISKIRFLEAEGLITPERTESGYRKFYEQDVSRLRTILKLQRDRFLPLKVIREHLEHGENGASSLSHKTEDAPAPTATPAVAAAPDLTGVCLDRQELQRVAGLSDQQLSGLEEFGIIDGRTDDSYDEIDLAIAKSARRLFDFGAEPRHLRMFRQFAEREVAFFEQIVIPGTRRRDPDAMAQASSAARELVGLASRLHDAALRSSSRRLM